MQVTLTENLSFDQGLEEELWNEYYLFDRLLFKCTHQHKSSIHFKRLKQASRILKKLEANYRVAAMIPEDTLIEINDLESLLEKLMDGHKLAQSSSSALEKAYLACRLTAGMTFFMSICLTFMGLLAKLRIQIKALMSCFTLLYDALYEARRNWILSSHDLQGRVRFPFAINGTILSTLPTLYLHKNAILKDNRPPKKEFINGALEFEQLEYGLQTRNSISDAFFEKKRTKKIRRVQKGKPSDDIDDIFGSI